LGGAGLQPCIEAVLKERALRACTERSQSVRRNKPALKGRAFRRAEQKGFVKEHDFNRAIRARNTPGFSR
jgi:hypothetical protein